MLAMFQLVNKLNDKARITGMVMQRPPPLGSDGSTGVILSKLNVRTSSPARKIAVGSATNVLEEDDI